MYLRGAQADLVGSGHVYAVVVEEEDPVRAHVELSNDMFEDLDIGLDHAKFEGQERAVERAQKRPVRRSGSPVRGVRVAETGHDSRSSNLGNDLGCAAIRAGEPVAKLRQEGLRVDVELPIRDE